MTGLQKAKSEETQRSVLEAAVQAVRSGGQDAVNIRKIAAQSGYSVGSVYKHYEDQDALISAVNAITLDRIRAAMLESIDPANDPVEQLKRLAHTYLAFARTERNLWLTLFTYQLPSNKDVPETQLEQTAALLELISVQLKRLHPDLDASLLAIRARTCFAALHGLVTISLEERFIGLSGDVLEAEMDFMVEKLVG